MTSPLPTLAAGSLLDAFLAEPGVNTMEGILRWLLDASPVLRGVEVPRTRRLALLAERIREHPRRPEIVARLRAIWGHRSAVRLLAETGLPSHVTLVKESIERLVDQLVPRLEPDDDLHVLLSRLRLTEPDVAWVEQLDAAALAPWRDLMAQAPALQFEAARLVAIRVAAAGVARELLELDHERPESASPFFRLGATVDALAVADGPPAWEAWTRLHTECGATLDHAHQRLETRGVTTDLIYRLELLEAGLVRLDDLLSTATGRRGGKDLAIELLRGSVRQRSVRSLAHTSLKRLARKMVEHTGETGERYVVRDRRDWSEIGRSAGWAGVLTAFTAVGKFALSGLPLAPMVLGLGLALNYTASFLLLQIFHLTLASKQPAMTAAALATALEHRDDLGEQVELVAGITRSQVIASIGNVAVTLPVSLALVAVSWMVAGTPLLSEETALHTVHGLHAVLSFTAPFAALTGVFLWISSLCAGWAANWAAYRGLAEAVARHGGLRRAVGAGRAAGIGRFIDHNLGGIVGYVALGFLLGFMPVVFKFMGLPIEVRHVTLNAATLALGAGSLYGSPAFHWSDVLWGLGGIVVMGACNFGVSFALALRTAMRARDLGRRERGRLWSAIRMAFRERPSRFLWRPTATPPRTTPSHPAPPAAPDADGTCTVPAPGA
jgi:site-specific recombinase